MPSGSVGGNGAPVSPVFELAGPPTASRNQPPKIPLSQHAMLTLLASEGLRPSWTDAPSPNRFTRDGSAVLEAQLAAICRSVLARVRQTIPASRLEAILLAG